MKTITQLNGLVYIFIKFISFPHLALSFTLRDFLGKIKGRRDKFKDFS